MRPTRPALRIDGTSETMTEGIAHGSTPPKSTRKKQENSMSADISICSDHQVWHLAGEPCAVCEAERRPITDEVQTQPTEVNLFLTAVASITPAIVAEVRAYKPV